MQFVYYVSAGLADEPEVLIDPNLLSADGTAALRATSVSECVFAAPTTACQLTRSLAKEWEVVCIRLIEERQRLADHQHSRRRHEAGPVRHSRVVQVLGVRECGAF